jgi:hypothetical protein
MSIVYAKNHKKYFIVWQDTRNYIPAPDDSPYYQENDIYARWLDEDGSPVGDEIPIYIGEGDQSMPQMVYSPVSDRFLITWWDLNAPDDYEPLPGEFGGEFGELSSVPMGMLLAGNVGGAIYGKPNPCAAEQIYGERAEETELLRYIRDNVLRQTPEGREIIRLYYQWSPAIVKALKGDAVLKGELKKMIDEIMPFLSTAVQ